jgi:hypothetical protein
MVKKIILILTSVFLLVASCSDKKTRSVFSQVLNNCELKGNSEYCNLGLHQKTLEEIKTIYGTPIDSFDFHLLSLDTCVMENGAFEDRKLATICSNLKEVPPIFCYTWDLGKDSCLNENIWLRIYFVEDDLRQYRAICSTEAREGYFYLE